MSSFRFERVRMGGIQKTFRAIAAKPKLEHLRPS
jgi:hypothetical protein